MKRTWDAFVKDHPRAICVVTAYGWKAPKVGLAQDGRKFPTPLGALSEVLSKTLKGEWSIRSERGKKTTLIHIVLADRTDLALIQRMFETGQSKKPDLPAPCSEIHQFAYDPSDYGRLAKAAGYVPGP